VKWILVLLVLVSCGATPQPKKQWYTNLGVVELSWTLTVWNPNKSTLKATYAQSAPGGVVGGFYWELEPDGNCQQLRFEGAARAQDGTRGLVIDDADIVRLEVNGSPACFAVVDTAPDPDDKFVKTYAGQGAKTLFRRVVVPRVQYTTATSISTIVANLSSSLPPAVTYVAGNVQGGLILAQPFDYVVASLEQILNDLAALCGCTWGVNSSGEFYFRQPSTTPQTIGYASAEPQFLTRHSEDIVTAVTFPIASVNPTVLYQKGTGGVFTETRQAPILFRYADAAHSVYNREIPEQIRYLDPAVKNQSGTLDASSSWSNSTNAADGDSATYAESGGTFGFKGLDLGQQTNLTKIIGVQIEYSTDDDPTELSLYVVVDDFTPPVTSVQVWVAQASLPKTGGHTTRNIVRIYGRYTGATSYNRISAWFRGIFGAGDVRVYDIAILEENTTALENYAKSFVKLPASFVRSVQLNNQLLTPTPRVQLTGTPSGTVTADAKIYKYNHDTKRTSTEIEVGTRGTSEGVRLMRQTMQILDERDRTTVRALVDRR
jgi:hypothetical protein